jgi:hypothetical protein
MNPFIRLKQCNQTELIIRSNEIYSVESREAFCRVRLYNAQPTLDVIDKFDWIVKELS